MPSWHVSGGGSGGGGGVTDHGLLTGLLDDDHPQYLRVQNVKLHGAVGDGSTNDTAAVNAAITAAESSTDVKIVWFPSGTYMVDSPILLDSAGITLAGGPGARLKARTQPTNPNAYVQVLADNITLDGVTFDMNMTTHTTSNETLVFVAGEDCTIKNCRFVDFADWGVLAGGAVSGLRVLDCYFEVDYMSGAPGGITLWSGSDVIEQFEITGNTVICTGDDASGIGIATNGAGGEISRGQIAHNTVIISQTGGTALSCGITAISLSGELPTNITVSSNIITCDADMFAWMSFRMANSAVVGNVCTFTGTSAINGVEMPGCETTTFEGNTLDGGGVIPGLFQFINASDNALIGNEISNPSAGGAAIAVYADGNGSTASSRNVISGNGIRVAGVNTRAVNLVPNHADANVDDNIVANNKVVGDGTANSRGILVDAISGSAARNTIQGNHLRDLLSALGVNNATETRIFDNKLSNIGGGSRFTWVIASSDTEVRGNSWQYDSAAPASEAHFRGEVVYNNTPSSGGPIGWACTAAGTPGTWVQIDGVGHIAAADPHTQYQLESALTEDVQDIVGAFATDSATVDFTYNDGAGTLTASVIQSGLDHGSIGGLGDDDHSQYALLAGRSGGQTLIGGTGSGDDLTLKSTSHATEGAILVPTFHGVAVWWDSQTLGTAEPSVINIGGGSSTWTFSTADTFPPYMVTANQTVVQDAALNAFAAPGLFVNFTIWKSAANATARDFKQQRVFWDSAIIKADTSADTMTDHYSFISAPEFSVLNSGTLALTNLSHFTAGSPGATTKLGAGVTVTNRRGLYVPGFDGAGTLTNNVAVDIDDQTEATTLNLSLRSFGETLQMRHRGDAIFGSGGVTTAPAAKLDVVESTEGDPILRLKGSPSAAASYVVRQQDGTTSGAATVNLDFPTVSSTSAQLWRVYTLAHQTNGVEEVGIYINELAVKNTGGTVTVNSIVQRVEETSAGSASWGVACSASGTNVRVACTGVAGDDITWLCHVEILSEGT